MRARELSPRDSAVAESLEMALGMTVDRIEAERDSLVESMSYFAYRWATTGELGAWRSCYGCSPAWASGPSWSGGPSR